MEGMINGAVCRWEYDPVSLNAMIAVHGEPELSEENHNGRYSMYFVFPDKTKVLLDKSIILQIIDSEDSNWLRVIKKESLQILFYREIATSFVGYYAYYHKESNAIEKFKLFFLTTQLRLNMSLATVKEIGYISQENGIREVVCVNNDFLFSNGSLYYRIESDTDIIVEVENEYNPDGCTNYRLAEILEEENFTLVQFFSENNLPIIKIERELVLSGELFTITPQVKAINAFAFYKCMNIEKIVIPSNIESIGEEAFACCGRLQLVEFLGVPTEIHPTALGYSAIVNIVIPDGTTDAFKQLLPKYSSKFIAKSQYHPIEFDNSAGVNCTSKTTTSLHEVTYDNKIGYIDGNGEIIVSALFFKVIGFFRDRNSKIVAMDENGWHVVSAKGEMFPLELVNKGKPIRLLDNKYLILEKGFNSHALYDIEENRYIIDYGVYDYMWDYSSNWRALRVRKGSKWGVIRVDGAIILPIIYPKVTMREDSCVYIDDQGIRKKLYFVNQDFYQPNCRQYYGDNYEEESWYAMTDGMYGDYPNVDTDYEFLGQ